MDGFSIWHWLLLLFCIALVVADWVALVRILNRTGYSGWWSLLTLVPIVNIYAFWRFSKAPWPAVSNNRS